MTATIADLGTTELLAQISQAGIALSVSDSKLIASPSSRLTQELRVQIAEAKPELLLWVLGTGVRAGSVSFDTFTAALKAYEAERSAA